MATPRPAAAAGSEEELLARAAQGDTHAFARIVRLHHELLMRVALVVTGDASSAGAATTEAFARAWSLLRRPVRRGRGHRPPAAAPWLAWLAAYAAAERIDGETRLRTAIEDYEPVAVAAAVPSPLAALPARDRALLALVVVAGLTADGIAAAAGRQADGVRLAIERAFAAASGALAPAAGAAEARRQVEMEVRRLASADVPLVDTDHVARRALGAGAPDWRWIVSVTVSAAIGLAVGTIPYWAPILHR